MTRLPRAGVVVVVVVVLAGAGCQRGSERFVGGLHAFAMTTDTPPAFETEDGPAFFLVEQRIEIPIVPPSEDELARLATPPGLDLPFRRLPWVERDDVEIEVDWVLRRVEDGTADPAEVDVVLDGGNEFFEYAPGFVSDENGVVPFFAQWERRVSLGPGESFSDTIREEAMAEVAIDLATLVNGAPDPNAIVAPSSDSARDPAARAYVPPVVPGLVAIRLGLRATTPANWVLESTLRVRDRGGRVAGRGDAAWRIRPPPVVLSGADVIAAAGEPAAP